MEKNKRMDQSVQSLLGLFEDLQVKIAQSYLHINIYCRPFTVAKVRNQPQRLSNEGIEKMQHVYGVEVGKLLEVGPNGRQSGQVGSPTRGDSLGPD